MKRPGKFQLLLIVGVLIAACLALMLYKVSALGFSFFPERETVVYQVEAKITFLANDGPVKVSLHIPERDSYFKVLWQDASSAGYGFSYQQTPEDERAVWTRRWALGYQEMFYTISVYDVENYDKGIPVNEPPLKPSVPTWEGPKKTSVEQVLLAARSKSFDNVSFGGQLYRIFNSNDPSQDARLLMGKSAKSGRINSLIISLLHTEGIPARLARGIQLSKHRKLGGLVSIIQLYQDGAWYFINPEDGSTGLSDDILLWQSSGVSLLDVEGGRNSKVSFSVIRDVRPFQELAFSREEHLGSALLKFSPMSLPVANRNMINLMMLVPLGALLVTIMRNLVGLPTSGTFMPVLIALSFRDTTLLSGLVIFIVIITIGLVIRSYLSSLNLLLVPRISAVVVIVIFIMAIITVLSHKLGLPQGMTANFFPTIILAWTVERLSIAWEEQGANDALKKTFGSLLVASLVYLLISNSYVVFLISAFPEINLLILGLILLIGVYTGYRLSELIRFEPLTRDDDGGVK